MAKASILIVEDDSAVAMEIRDSLRDLGYGVSGLVSCAEEAIEKAAESRPDLVLIDIRLKGDSDGPEAAERIRARIESPIVYLASGVDQDTLRRAQTTEPLGYVLRSFHEGELQAAIEIALHRHKIETDLRERERWLASVLRSVGDGVIATDRRGTIGFMNAVAEKLTDCKEEDALGKAVTKVLAIVDEQTGSLAECSVARVLREGVAVGADASSALIARHGRRTPVDATAAPIRDDQGEIIGVVLAFRDMTERKRTEDETRRRAARQEALNAVIAAAAGAQEVTDLLKAGLDHTLQGLGLTTGGIWVSGQHAVHGLPARFAEALARTCREAGLAVLSPTSVNDWQEMAESDPLSALTPLMESFHIRASVIVPILDKTRCIGGLVVVSEQRRPWSPEEIALVETVGHQLGGAAERLTLLDRTRQQAQQVQGIMDTVPEGVLLLGADSRILLANAAAREYLSVLTDARVGDALTSLGRRPIEELLEPPAAGSWHEIEGLANVRRVFEATARPMETGPRSGSWVLVLRDVTTQREIEHRVRQQDRMAVVGQLAAGTAHDFNNLLTVIMGYSELLLSSLDLDDALRDDIIEIEKAGRRAASLTRQLLAFSRRQILQREVLELNALVANIEKMLRRVVGEDIELIAVEEPRLKRITADPGQIEQVIVNLVVNARDAMPHGGKLVVRTRNVTLTQDQCDGASEARPGEFVCLSVMDTGEGMDEETVEHIFEPFFTTKDSGTGLGLAVAYGIVHQHEGWITVDTKLGEGSTFEVWLPACSTQAEDESEEKVALQMLRGGDERILLVEDEAGVRAFVAKVLRDKGYVVFEAADAKGALDIFERENGEINLVFSDVVLPDGTGLQLADQLRSRKGEVPVLLGSGYTDEKSQWAVTQERGLGFVRKPYAPAELLLAVRQAMEPH